jgi:hypothetical protein
VLCVGCELCESGEEQTTNAGKREETVNYSGTKETHHIKPTIALYARHCFTSRNLQSVFLIAVSHQVPALVPPPVVVVLGLISRSSMRYHLVVALVLCCVAMGKAQTVSCPAGSYVAGNSSNPFCCGCPAGSFSSSANAQYCKECPAGMVRLWQMDGADGGDGGTMG